MDKTWLRCPCLGDEHTLAMLKGKVILGSLAFSQDQDWKLAGLEARTGEVLWQLETPKKTFALLTDGAYMIAASQKHLQAWRLGVEKA